MRQYIKNTILPIEKSLQRPFLFVEMAGIEPASKNVLDDASTTHSLPQGFKRGGKK